MEDDALRVWLCEIPDPVDEHELKRDMESLPAWRRKEADAFRFPVDKMQNVKAYLLLCRGLREQYGIIDQPRFGYGENGKPYLTDHPQIHFNLSHCRKGVICAIGDSPVGCDIEAIPDGLDSDLLRACFSTTEQEDILHADNPRIEFARLWTRKEALLKLHGIGLIDSLPALLASPLADGVSFHTEVHGQAKFAYTICKKIRIKIIEKNQ